MISLKEKSLLIIVDMQNDFIDGSLGFDKAQSIIPAIKNLISKFQKFFRAFAHLDFVWHLL